MELDIIQIISLLIVFVSLLLAAFLLTVRSENYLSNLLLALFLIVNAQDSDSIFVGGYIYPSMPALGMLINSTVFLKLPLLWLYLLSVTYSNFKLKPKHLLHALPFLINNLVLVPRFYGVGFDEQMDFITRQTLSFRHPEIYFSYFLIHTQILVYLIACFILIARYRKLLLENFSNASMFNYRWLLQFFTIFSVNAVIASLKNLFMFMDMSGPYFWSLLITATLSLIYFIWIVYKMMRHPELFRGIDIKLKLVSSMVKEEAYSNAQPELNKSISKNIALLNSFMESEKPFLEPSLTIYDLAKKINMSTKDLSLLINHELNQHFFDFVNNYRIRMAMEILVDHDKKDLTILEILYEVGFNSKSSFNTAFKKHVGVTPTQYRQKHLSSAA